MSTTARQLTRVTTTRPIKKLQKPRPLKTQNPNKHSSLDTSIGVFEEIMNLAETVANNLTNGNIDRSLQTNIVSLNGMLKSYGENLEVIYKDQLDRVFVIFRNGCRDENVDYVSRLHLLELIELRAMQWNLLENNSYYKHKCNIQDIELSVASLENSLNSTNSVFQHNQMSTTLNQVVTQPLLLGPDELVKSSGKFAAPTKIPGKNYCKDEVVIRNSDSGKVMGIKGRRVHMIEELSETVISFQRVSPGARERLVQITGPTENKIIYAKQLMEDTIRRNASPIRTELLERERLGSSSSLNSSTSDDSLRYKGSGSKRSALLHSFSTNDANLGEYKYTVTVGDSNLKITGTNLDLVRVAKLVLDEYFSLNTTDTNEYDDDGTTLFEPVISSDAVPNLTSQDSEESEDTYKVQQPLSGFGITKSSSIRKLGIPALVNRHTYSAEELFYLADSPLSRQIPENWQSIMKGSPAIMKKIPVTDWVDSKTYLKRRPQETISQNIIIDICEPNTPE